ELGPGRGDDRLRRYPHRERRPRHRRRLRGTDRGRPGVRGGCRPRAAATAPSRTPRPRPPAPRRKRACRGRVGKCGAYTILGESRPQRRGGQLRALLGGGALAPRPRRRRAARSRRRGFENPPPGRKHSCRRSRRTADVLIPMAEEAAEAAGRYLAEHGPDVLRRRIVPKLIEAFNDVKQARWAGRRRRTSCDPPRKEGRWQPKTKRPRTRKAKERKTKQRPRRSSAPTMRSSRVARTAVEPSGGRSP